MQMATIARKITMQAHKWKYNNKLQAKNTVEIRFNHVDFPFTDFIVTVIIKRTIISVEHNSYNQTPVASFC